MTIVINGTSGISGVDGSAGTPAIQGSDTNTGEFFPAADTVAWSTGGSERMRIDSSGNLGLGVTPSAWSAMTALQVKQASLVGYVNQAKLFANAYFDGSNYKYIASDYASELRQTTGRFEFYTAPSGTAGNTITFTQAMTLDASGNLGIGTSSPSTRLTVADASPTIRLLDTTTAVVNGVFGTLDWLSSDTSMSGGLAAKIDAIDTGGVGDRAALRFFTNNGTSLGERMRIDTSGNVGIGTTNANPISYNSDNTVVTIKGNSAPGTAQLLLQAFGSTANDQALGQLNFLDGSNRNALINASRATSTSTAYLAFFTSSGSGVVERMRIDPSGNTYVETGALWQYAPAPTALAAGANAVTAAQLQGDIFTAAQTTAVTMTLPTGTNIDAGFTGASFTANIGFDFHVVNTGSSAGAVTVAVNTGVTSVGSLTVAITTSAHFRLRRTAANTYIVYRLS